MTTVVDRPVAEVETPAPPRSRPPRLLIAATAGALVAGIVLRFYVRSELWLDEALSVNIARLPVGQIPGALRHDGAPPLYYVVLHYWMDLFGTGSVAVRALSGVCAVAMLPLLFIAGRRIGGRRVGVAAALIAASSPFATHYATETRMYSMVALLVLVGFLVLDNALDRPSPVRLAWLTVATAALLYTHYWAIYLLTVVGSWLLWRAWRSRRDGDRAEVRTSVLAAGAIALGGVLFLPWVPSFLYQAAHTGTPWAQPADFGALVSVIGEFSGGGSHWAQMLAFVLFSLAVLGVFGTALDHHRVELDLRTRPKARPLLVVLLATPALAILLGLVTRTAFVARYTSVVFPVFCLLVALGIVAFAEVRTAAIVLGAATALGLWCSYSGAMWAPRSQAGEFAAAIEASAQPGDVVAFCPDQLGPAVSRLLEGGPAVDLVTYPRRARPERVDWVDYGDAIKAAPVADFARFVSDRAGAGRTVWLVAGKGYRPYNGRCNVMIDELTELRGEPTTAVRNRPIQYFEHGTLYRFGSP